MQGVEDIEQRAIYSWMQTDNVKENTPDQPGDGKLAQPEASTSIEESRRCVCPHLGSPQHPPLTQLCGQRRNGPLASC